MLISSLFLFYLTSNIYSQNIEENKHDHSPFTDNSSCIRSSINLSTADFEHSDQNNLIPDDIKNNTYPVFSIDNSQFKIPKIIKNEIVDFGYLRISDLRDYNLSVCGHRHSSKCTVAQILTYTEGTLKDGLYNSKEQYGLPIFSGQLTLPRKLIRLGRSNALELQRVKISKEKTSLTLRDFPNPKYSYSIDFRDAGTGTFSTKIIIEYCLSP